MMLSIYFNQQTCIRKQCGVTFATTNEFDELRREDHADFFCPNGHSQHYTGENKAEKYQRRYEEEFARCKELTSDLAVAAGSIRAYKGHATRHRQEASA